MTEITMEKKPRVSKMEKTQIFNAEGNDVDKEKRKIWFGETTNLIQLNDIKYNWALGLYKQMREKFWIPQRIDLSSDVVDYNNLSEDEMRCYNGILSYLTFLDSIQVSNLPNIELPITAPEVKICLSEQKYFETIHAESYQYMIESIIPTENRIDIYEFWRTDKVLKDRCKFVAQFYQQYIDKPNKETYFIALIANYLLEGIYFYNGFQFFFTLASRMLMGGSADVIKLIQRDEIDHVRIFQQLIPEAMQVFTFSEEQIYEMINTAVEHECKWSSHITNNNILGISDHSTEQYTKYLANLRLKAIGLAPLYDEVLYGKNPYKHLEKVADLGNDAGTKANFFETTVTSYVMSSSIDGWDDF